MKTLDKISELTMIEKQLCFVESLLREARFFGSLCEKSDRKLHEAHQALIKASNLVSEARAWQLTFDRNNAETAEPDGIEG